MALLDLLPAGFEIESVVNDETVKSFPFLRQDHADPHRRGARRPLLRRLRSRPRLYRSWWDERRRTTTNAFHVAYVVRAVTPGSFALPAVNVSDMYAPRIYARSDMGRVTIAPR